MLSSDVGVDNGGAHYRMNKRADLCHNIMLGCTGLFIGKGRGHQPRLCLLHCCCYWPRCCTYQLQTAPLCFFARLHLQLWMQWAHSTLNGAPNRCIETVQARGVVEILHSCFKLLLWWRMCHWRAAAVVPGSGRRSGLQPRR
jgi:hypothetical protein